jgi:carbon-monoxide dehydrogenase medium subunit
MRPAIFEYHAPDTVEEALSLLEMYGEEAKVLAGGQSLIPMMKMRLIKPNHIIDVYKKLKKELSYIKEVDGKLRVGALTTHYEILTSDLVRAKCPILAKAAENIGDWQVRNMGTVGGSLCHADPAAHYLPVAVALDAELLVRSSSKERIVKASEFFKDVMTTALLPNEILIEVRVPKLDGYGWGYEVIQRRSGDYALCISTILLRLKAKVCESAKIVIGGATPTPLEMKNAEKILEGKKLDEKLIDEAAVKVYESLARPMSDIKASAEYRREMAKILTKRALTNALRG